jgi:hypothetical protein
MVKGEALVLGGLKRQVRAHFDLTTGTQPMAALELVTSDGP